jgi:hypothetical protein
MTAVLITGWIVLVAASYKLAEIILEKSNSL